MRPARSSRIFQLFLLALTPVAAAGDSLSDAVTQSHWGLDFRQRIEWVDDDSFDRDAKASTLRTRLNLKTGRWQGVQAFIEFSDVREVGFDNFNAAAGATPNRDRFPVVADSEDTRVNQAWVAFRPDSALELRAGRQRIKLDNDRFVGNVIWRQNEQTYDGASLDWDQRRWNLFYSYINQANRIFASKRPAGAHDHDTHLLNLAFSAADGHRFVGYVYDIEDENQGSFSSRTTGLRYEGTAPLGELGALDWLAEYAHQVDAGNNAVDYNADYFHLKLDLGMSSILAPRVGFERLEGSRSAGESFRTPLATLHAFNGWADVFLTTPDQGLDDVYAGFNGDYDHLEWNVTWHRFHSEQGGERLGNELDASLSIRTGESSSVLLKAAHFSADASGFRDTTKFWLMFSLALP